MFDSAVFDVVVGLVFLLATFSVIVSAATETVARWEERTRPLLTRLPPALAVRLYSPLI